MGGDFKGHLSPGIKSSIMAASFKVMSRGFSSTASLGQLVKTPTAVFGTEGRYAAALYSAATKQKDLQTMKATIQKDKKFADFLADPSVKKTVKAEGLSGACDKLKLNALS